MFSLGATIRNGNLCSWNSNLFHLVGTEKGGVPTKVIQCSRKNSFDKIKGIHLHLIMGSSLEVVCNQYHLENSLLNRDDYYEEHFVTSIKYFSKTNVVEH